MPLGGFLDPIKKNRRARVIHLVVSLDALIFSLCFHQSMKPAQIHVRAAPELGGGAVRLKIHQVPRKNQALRGGSRVVCVPSTKPFAFLNTDYKKLVPAEANDFIFVYDRGVKSENFGKVVTAIEPGAQVATKYEDAYLQGYFLSFNTANGMPAINKAAIPQAVVGALYEIPKRVVAAYKAAAQGRGQVKDIEVHVPGHGKATALVAIPATHADYKKIPDLQSVHDMWSSTKDSNWKALLSQTLPDFEATMKVIRDRPKSE
jgi:hypothetical protein